MQLINNFCGPTLTPFKLSNITERFQYHTNFISYTILPKCLLHLHSVLHKHPQSSQPHCGTFPPPLPLPHPKPAPHPHHPRPIPPTPLSIHHLTLLLPHPPSLLPPQPFPLLLFLLTLPAP